MKDHFKDFSLRRMESLTEMAKAIGEAFLK
jgi:hypothetical protein